MKVRQIMTTPVVGISPEETVEVAARTLAGRNIGSLPVCQGDKICGMLTDRDLVMRCMALGKAPGEMLVRDVMTARVLTVNPEMETGAAAHLMGRAQIRRLPVVENGKLCGMVSIGDLVVREDSAMDAADALSQMAVEPGTI